MKILLTAINAKYIHSNLAVYSLQAYAEAQGHKIERAEYTINNQLDDILEKIYCQKPDVLIFSCYIWNIEYVRELAAEFHKLRPEVPIWVGGPEVSFETERFLKENPAITGIMMGEGERTLTELCTSFEQESSLEKIDGISYRRGVERWRSNPCTACFPWTNFHFVMRICRILNTGSFITNPAVAAVFLQLLPVFGRQEAAVSQSSRLYTGNAVFY